MDLQTTFLPNLSLTNTYNSIKTITSPNDNLTITYLQHIAVIIIGPAILLIVDRSLHYLLCRLTLPNRSINYRPAKNAILEFICAYLVTIAYFQTSIIRDPVKLGVVAAVSGTAVKVGLVVGILLMRLMCVMVVWVLRRSGLVDSARIKDEDVEKGACEHFEERFAGQK